MEWIQVKVVAFFLFQERRDLRMVMCDLYLRFGVIKTVMKTHQIKSVTLFVWGMLAIFWDTGDELFKTIHMKLCGDVQ